MLLFFDEPLEFLDLCNGLRPASRLFPSGLLSVGEEKHLVLLVPIGIAIQHHLCLSTLTNSRIILGKVSDLHREDAVHHWRRGRPEKHHVFEHVHWFVYIFD